MPRFYLFTDLFKPVNDVSLRFIKPIDLILFI